MESRVVAIKFISLVSMVLTLRVNFIIINLTKLNIYIEVLKFMYRDNC